MLSREKVKKLITDETDQGDTKMDDAQLESLLDRFDLDHDGVYKTHELVAMRDEIAHKKERELEIARATHQAREANLHRRARRRQAVHLQPERGSFFFGGGEACRRRAPRAMAAPERH